MPAETPPSPVRLGTRGSALALAQAHAVASALEASGVPVDIVTIQTEGDRRVPDTAWGEGAFVAAIERALVTGEVDAGVHSAKDLPTLVDARLAIAAFLPREDPRDALVTRDGGATLETLPAGARVGTDSPRRTGFLLAARPDLRPHPLNGNVDTRLRRLDAGETDALCLAVAGLVRLGREDRIDERVLADLVPPAPGQGAICVQVRTGDARVTDALAALDDRPTRIAVEAERAFLCAAGGGCRAPIGALATIEGEVLRIQGGYVSPDGRSVARATLQGPASDGEALGARLAATLGERLPGVARDLRSTGRVLIARTEDQSRPLADALRAAGLDPLVVPAIAIHAAVASADLDRALMALGRYAWVVVTSANAVPAIASALTRQAVDPAASCWAAVGDATAGSLQAAGIRVDHQPADADAAALAASLPIAPGDRVLLARADIADHRLPGEIAARGATVDAVVAYRTVEAPPASRALLAEALAGPRIEAVVLTSGSTARGLLRLAAEAAPEAGLRDALLGIPAVCIGPRTAEEARRLGYSVVAEAAAKDTASLARLVTDIVRRSA